MSYKPISTPLLAKQGTSEAGMQDIFTVHDGFILILSMYRWKKPRDKKIKYDTYYLFVTIFEKKQ